MSLRVVVDMNLSLDWAFHWRTRGTPQPLSEWLASAAVVLLNVTSNLSFKSDNDAERLLRNTRCLSDRWCG